MTSGQILSKIAITHLSAQTELDLIHQDESVWHDGLWPVQQHTALNLVTPLVHHLPRDVICSDWGNTDISLLQDCVYEVLQEKVSRYTVP